MLVCPLLFAVGLALLLASETSGLAALRIVAVALLLAGAVGGGARAALATTPPALFTALAARLTPRFARGLAVVLALPAAATLLIAPVAMLGVGTPAALFGALVAIGLLAVLVFALTLAFKALRRAEQTS